MEPPDLQDGEPSNFWSKNKLSIVILLVGLILIGVGVLGFKVFEFQDGPKVEILGTTEGGEWKVEAGTRDERTEAGKVTVEAAGEVTKPGVYQLPEGSRVDDLLTAAGGLSAKADREWMAKNINLAAKLVDGGKIYIPGISEVGSGPPAGPLRREASEAGKMEAGKDVGSGNFEKININTASESVLDTLWGIGPATAKKIIEARPYQKIEELLEKKIVKSNVWEKIKDEITIY